MLNSIKPIVSLRCWNHLLENIESWVKRHDGFKHDWSFYKTQTKSLFNQKTKTDYIELLKNYSTNWDENFRIYFNECIHPNIDAFARWSLEKYGFYNPYSGFNLVVLNQLQIYY